MTVRAAVRSVLEGADVDTLIHLAGTAGLPRIYAGGCCFVLGGLNWMDLRG